MDGRAFKRKETLGRYSSIDEIMAEIDKEAVFYNESGGGVTLSGGEPLLQPDFAIELLKTCKHRGYNTALDTCGYVKQEVLAKAARFTDLILYDLKHHDTNKHKHYTGVDNALILENLSFLIKLGKVIRVRIPLIPGTNDSEEDMEAFSVSLKNIGFKGQIDLLPFHNLADSKYARLIQENRMKGVRNMKNSELVPAKKYFEAQGFEVKIGG